MQAIHTIMLQAPALPSAFFLRHQYLGRSTRDWLHVCRNEASRSRYKDEDSGTPGS